MIPPVVDPRLPSRESPWVSPNPSPMYSPINFFTHLQQLQQHIQFTSTDPDLPQQISSEMNGATFPQIPSEMNRATFPQISSEMNRETFPQISSEMNRETFPQIPSEMNRETFPQIPSEMNRATFPQIPSEMNRAKFPRISSEMNRATFPQISSEMNRATFPQIPSEMNRATLSQIPSEMNRATLSQIPTPRSSGTLPYINSLAPQEMPPQLMNPPHADISWMPDPYSLHHQYQQQSPEEHHSNNEQTYEDNANHIRAYISSIPAPNSLHHQDQQQSSEEHHSNDEKSDMDSLKEANVALSIVQESDYKLNIPNLPELRPVPNQDKYQNLQGSKKRSYSEMMESTKEELMQPHTPPHLSQPSYEHLLQQQDSTAHKTYLEYAKQVHQIYTCTKRDYDRATMNDKNHFFWKYVEAHDKWYRSQNVNINTITSEINMTFAQRWYRTLSIVYAQLMKKVTKEISRKQSSSVKHCMTSLESPDFQQGVEMVTPDIWLNNNYDMPTLTADDEMPTPEEVVYWNEFATRRGMSELAKKDPVSAHMDFLAMREKIGHLLLAAAMSSGNKHEAH